MQERSIEAGLRREVEKRGGLTFKFTAPGQAGVPDRIIIHEGRVVFVELKQENGRLSPVQQVMIQRMRKHGAEVHVAYGMDEVRELVREVIPDGV